MSKKELTDEEMIDVFAQIAELADQVGWSLLVINQEDATTPGLIMGNQEFLDGANELYEMAGFDIEQWDFEKVGNEELH